MSIHILRIDL
jgi:hypothetical protein